MFEGVEVPEGLPAASRVLDFDGLSFLCTSIPVSYLTGRSNTMVSLIAIAGQAGNSTNAGCNCEAIFLYQSKSSLNIIEYYSIFPTTFLPAVQAFAFRF